MSINDINNAAAAMNQLKARYEGFLDGADVQIAARQAAYDALAGDLRGVVGSQMLFTATVDPDESNPTNMDGGTFNTLKAAIDAAPAGSFVLIDIPRGVICSVNADIQLAAKTVLVTSLGVGAKPVIEFAGDASAANNFIRGFAFSYGGAVRFSNCDILLPEKLDPALPWSASPAAMAYTSAGTAKVGFHNGTISGPSGVGLASCYTSTFVEMRLYNCTLDTVTALIRATGGCATISCTAVTLVNGAQLTDGGTIGANILQN